MWKNCEVLFFWGRRVVVDVDVVVGCWWIRGHLEYSAVKVI